MSSRGIIFGVGNDLLELRRVTSLLQKHSFAHVGARMLSAEERLSLEAITTFAKKADFLAKAFCAKEAFVKACGLGFRNPLYPTELTLKRNNYGKPYFIYSAKVQAWLAKNEVHSCFLAITDTKELISAVVVLQS